MRICPQCSQRTDARVCPQDGFQTVDEAMVAESSDPRVGRVFEGRYRIDGVLGRGGMGTVYRATQLAIGRPVAIKVLNAECVTDLKLIARFQQEARSVAALRHPNTIRLIDFGQADDGTLFLVMEFLEGEPLSALIKREAPLAPERVIQIGTQVLESLAEAHNVGIVHRDLKPDNLFVTELFGRQDFLKILDFGIAKVTGFGDEATLTAAGVALGSPRYMAPEQISAATVDARADLYALGVVLYELLSGRPPFVCQSVTEYMLAHIERDVPELRREGQTLVGRLPEFIYDCLSKHPTHRPPSALAALETLRGCAGAPYSAPNAPSLSRAPVTETDSAAGRTRSLAPEATSIGEMHPAVTAAEAAAASQHLAPRDAWPGAPRGRRGATQAESVALKGSETGLSPRPAKALERRSVSASGPPAWALALAALALVALGLFGVALREDAKAPQSALSREAPAASPPAVAEVAPSEGSPEPQVAEPSPENDGVVMLVTVPSGATVSRGGAVLGVTPFALVWGGDTGAAPLKVKLKGYQGETIRAADLGASQRYELYLRPKSAKAKAPRGAQKKTKGAWVETLSKPKARVTPTPKAPRAKPSAYEELD